ncbi:carnitine O-palmitoyltransferase 1, liver isoform [Rhipicephalus sanguineus]|uniref:carnitine O-palmitoyltransferase 1, liver isoform n=1 Tax=Rhipicephalus sanguineus TaxID=34632 RepID=UPI0018948F62|nr:carnitine O-palmitoyltransferase 1, liver isoform [Rhipicephalus sanguineus]XP_049272328.1 carnitine O-palmitoyltransferase 1, liver isoform [Rhipicephalus sanguineus]
MAEARSAVAGLQVREIEDEQSSCGNIFRVWLRTAVRKYHRVRNSISNGMWPTSVLNICILCILVFLFMLSDIEVAESIKELFWDTGDKLHVPHELPATVRAIIVACFISVVLSVVFMKVRQIILRSLLSYRGWMYEPTTPGQRYLTMLWCLAVRVVSGYQPSLYSCQRSLPRLPVPALHDTIVRLLESLRAVCTPEEMKVLEMQAQKFESTLGPTLQRLLYLRSWISSNYVTEWWEKYIYLSNRMPLAINSNYYCFDQSYSHPSHIQSSRTAVIIHNCLVFKRLIDREELQPLVLRGTVPICMSQYERLFSTTRVPGVDIDEICHYSSTESKHVMLQHKGFSYKLDVYDAANQILFPTTLEHQIEWIMEDAKKHTASEAEASLAALTTLDRVTWAKIRQKHFSHGINRESLNAIEKATFFVSMNDLEPRGLTERGKLLLHGDGRSIWFDKSLNVQVFKDCTSGMNCEHSMADAPAMAHMWESTITREVLEKLYDESGRCMPPGKKLKQYAILRPQRLVWDISPELEKDIAEALAKARKANDDLDLFVRDHDGWGKGVIKKCRVSPDAFIQMALQLAYYKENKKFVQTYEASMTRLYLNGRTETVRSCTIEATEFVRAMVENSVSTEEKIRLLKRACAKHQRLYRDAMSGKGVDRHLFALYVACKGLKYESEFLTNVLMRPWTLSTSQTPHTQLDYSPDADLEVFRNKICPGGGFGPVSDDGYGVSYIFPNNSKIFFHVSSKKSCASTNSERFVRTIEESMDEMKALFGF